MAGEPASELGRGKETRHDRPSAGSAQVCRPAGSLQGTSHFISHNSFVTLKALFSFLKKKKICNDTLFILTSLALFTGGTGEESDRFAVHYSHSDDV